MANGKRIRWLMAGVEYASIQASAVRLACKEELTPEEKQTLKQICERRERWYREHLYDWVVFPPWLRWREPKSIYGAP